MIPAIDFMSFAGVVDFAFIMFYVNYIKTDKSTIGFRSLVSLDWGTSPGGINCKLSFDLSTSVINVVLTLRYRISSQNQCKTRIKSK
jgi:hypothetical protein